jgi:hypothetical protein
MAAFALLAICAILAAAYVLFLRAPSSASAPAKEGIDAFYNSVSKSDSVSVFFDLRGAEASSTGKVYQCGVDMVSGPLFGSRKVYSYACDDSGCISANSGSNSTGNLTYQQVLSSIQKGPYAILKYGAPSTKFYETHMEISVDESFNSSCRFG